MPSRDAFLLLQGITTEDNPIPMVFEFGDNFSLVYGQNTIKFGVEFRKVEYQDNITFNLGDEYGDYFYNGNDATGFSTYLLGRIDDAVQAQNGPDGRPYGYHYGGFLQDEFKLLHNLTLTLGLRYEFNTPFSDATFQLGNFDRNYPGGRLVIQNEETSLINPLWKIAVGSTPFVTASQAGLPDNLRYLYKRNYQPRFGFAWSPGSKNDTTVRASFGKYSVPVLGAVLYSLLGVDTSYYADYGATTFPNAFPTGADRGVAQSTTDRVASFHSCRRRKSTFRLRLLINNSARPFAVTNACASTSAPPPRVSTSLSPGPKWSCNNFSTW